MRILSNFETAKLSGGMGNGAGGGNGFSPVNKGNGLTAAGNGVVGGAVTGFFGSLATSTPIGAAGVMVGSILGGYIASGGLAPSASAPTSDGSGSSGYAANSGRADGGWGGGSGGWGTGPGSESNGGF